MAKPVGVVVIGLNELIARLAQAQTYEPELVRTHLKAVAQVVVDEIIPEMQSMFVSDPSRLDGALENSVRAASAVTIRGGSASIKEGSEGRGNGDGTAPYAGWWEFGGPRAKSNRPPNRRFIKKGRVIFPAVKRKQPEIIAAVEHAMDEVAKMIEGKP